MSHVPSVLVLPGEVGQKLTDKSSKRLTLLFTKPK